VPEFDDQESSVPDPDEFTPEDADIDEEIAFRSAFADALAQNGFPDTLVLARERAEDIFHPRRLEIIDYLEEHDPESVRALATALDYDKGVVSRDLQTLAHLDVIESDESGRAKTPRLKHRHVAVEPVV
jgi:predicted transcriptional regulator